MDQAKQRMEAAIKEKMKMKSAAAAAAPPSSSSPSPLASSADLPPPDILVHVVIGNPKERLMEIAQEVIWGRINI